MKILSNDTLNEIAKYTIQHEGVTALELSENTAELVASEISSRWSRTIPVTVLSGWGNNGTDAMLTAALLVELGYSVDVFLFNINDRITPEGRVARGRLTDDLAERKNLRFVEISGRERFVMPDPPKSSLIIDGLFGAGLKKAMPVSFQMLVRNINQSGASVVSIDMPSGLMDEWNDKIPRESVMHATLTLALGAPRLSFMIAENHEAVGEWKVLDIGLSHKAMAEAPYKYYLVQKNTVAQFLKPRNINCTKDNFGNVLLCAGSKGMFGAAILSGHAALRGGAGRVTIRSAASGLNAIQTAVPCAMFSSDKNNDHLTDIPAHKENVITAIGPGIGTADSTIDAMEHFLKTCTSSDARIVIDADGLNALALRPRMMEYLPLLTVLTPHAKEFDRIFGEMHDEESRLKKALQVANYHRVIIMLKTHYTAVVRPDGKVFFNSSGTPALATPGSGDVLTGLIAALMAQGHNPEKATFMAAYIHGYAGHLAENTYGEYGVTAMDIAQNIGIAMRDISES